MTLYLDASAAVKLVLHEAESLVLHSAVQGSRLVTSALTRVEAHRAVLRAGLPVADQVDAMLDTFHEVAIDPGIIHRAGRPRPPLLRSLDAIHIASAMPFGADLEALITYDHRMATAAADVGLRVRSPA